MNSNIEKLGYQTQLATAKEAIRGVMNCCLKPIITTKFNQDSAVILHLVTQINPDIPVIWVDTSFNTQETLEFSDTLIRRLNLTVYTFRPQASVSRNPPNFGTTDHDAFVNTVKLEPFKRALKELKADAWFSSIRRYQSSFRFQHTMFELLSNDIMKTSPMLDWTPEMVNRYLTEHKLPLGPICFDPTKGTHAYQECGLHCNRV